MTVKEVTVKNAVGLYARPLTFFVTHANMYKCSIWVSKGEKRVIGKSLIGLLTLDVAVGDTISIITDGNDEKEALEDLVHLIETGFEEEYKLYGINIS